MANLKRFCTVKKLENVKQYLMKSWEPFVALWVQFYRNEFWSGQVNTNNISEGRVGSFKKGLKNVTDGSIFSAVKYLLETYIPNDIQDFRALNRDNAWENKKLVRLQGVSFLQNRPPGAVAAINNVYARAADAIERRVYRYQDLGSGKYCVSNIKNGHTYTFILQKANCTCVDRITNVYKIPCIHAIVLILCLKLDWSHFHLDVRRNIRNSLIKLSGDEWIVLGPPKGTEDKAIESLKENVEPSPSDNNFAMELDFSDTKEDMLQGDQSDNDFLNPYEPRFESPATGEPHALLSRLPTGKSEVRLVKDYFRKIHDSAGRIKETFFNLQGALRVASNQKAFAADWIDKKDLLNAAQQKLLEVESMLMVATGGVSNVFPVVSNLEEVRAMNKSGVKPQLERRPRDVRELQRNRKRAREAARTALATLQTPLVEANRPNKKRESEASRHQKNYLAAVKKRKVPKVLHSFIIPSTD